MFRFPVVKSSLRFPNESFNMFITAVCFIFLIILRWPKTKSFCDLTSVTTVTVNIIFLQVHIHRCKKEIS